MKKTLAALLTLFAGTSVFQNAIAQNTSPYWSLAGNSNATTSSKLGTTNGVSLRFYANNQQRMIIGYSTGNVGIGMASPTARLHVDAPAGTIPFVVQANGSTKLYLSGNGGLSVGGSSTPPANGLFVAGKVGIGTSQPKYNLEVLGSDGVYVKTSPAVYDQTPAISAYSGGLSGVYAESGLTGVEGVARGGHYEDGPWLAGIGVRGEANGQEAIGVLGYTTKNNVSDGFIREGDGNDVGVQGIGSYGVVGSGDSTGVLGAGQNYGVVGKGKYGFAFVGVYGMGDTGVLGRSYTLYGMRGISNGSNDNSRGVYGTGYNGVYGETKIAGGQGLYGIASGTNAWGVRGYSANSHGVYGSTGSTSSYAGYFSGKVYTTASYVSSDRSLKRDIADVTSAMDIIGKLKPKTYSFKQDGDYKLMNLPQGKHYGLIAQEVEQVLPELVNATTFDAGKAAADADPKQTVTSKEISFKALNYTELIPIVVKGMQEQEQHLKELDEKTAEIAGLKSRIETLEALIRGGSGAPVSVASLAAAAPNPVKGSTRIGYTIPADSRAQLLVTDAAGKTIKVMTLTNSGYTNLNTAGFSSGTYNYSLIVDGKVADTKKLLIAR